MFTLMGLCGIRLVCRCLELTGLDRFVAASYSPHQKVSVAIEEAVIEFGRAERKRLGQDMPPKQITICEDETYPPEICLVAIEPASNFILLEKYAQSRRAKEWTQAIKETTTGLPVQIIQSASDEGRGIVKHVKKDLGAHHCPDLFHVQNEIIKGPSTAWAGRKRQAAQAMDKATEKVQRYQAKKRAYLNDEGRPKCPPGLKKKIEQAQMAETEANPPLETAPVPQEQLKQAIREISRAYPPYDLQTGAPRSAERVSTSLAEQFSEIEAVSTEADLSERCFKRIKKAKGVTEWAHLFQRSSSCVEGRNGQLALFHHSLHRLSNRKRAALTSVHNYFIKRPDGTTAAQRFFGAKPKDLFKGVLDRVDLPARPAQKRSQPQQMTYLVQATA